MTKTEREPFRDFLPGFRWEGVDRLAYKAEGSAPFKAITRQVLFSDPALACELRYFEIDAGGHSTLERHDHVHAVMVARGSGHCLVGNEVRTVKTFDLVSVPPGTWHQFRATRGEALGFICMVNAGRDRPQLPNEDEVHALRADPRITAFLDDRPS
ncbi:MAG: cupin domain-containing protein [Rhodospirillales bacterium]|nr:cupin domain-containing protein [Rhodospirillales bacterium]